MFKIVLIFLTIILYKILANTFNISIQEMIIRGRASIMQSNLIMQGKTSIVIITYNIIYFYSICQIKCNQLYNNFLPYLDMFKNENELIDNINKQTIELFDLSTNKNKFFTEKEQEVFNQIMFLPNNLLIISELSNHMILNKKIINNKINNKIDRNICNYNFDISKITFIALYLNYKDIRYNINLKTEEFNYYLVGNIIDKQFVQYYINNILKLNFCYKDEELSSSYQLELMDHEVNMIILNAKQSIFIEKDSYRIDNDVDNDATLIVADVVKEKVE